MQQISAVAGDAGEQTLISISTDTVKRPRSVITISQYLYSGFLIFIFTLTVGKVFKDGFMFLLKHHLLRNFEFCVDVFYFLVEFIDKYLCHIFIFSLCYIGYLPWWMSFII